MIDLDEIAVQLRLERVLNLIKALVRPAVAFDTRKCDDDQIRIGVSKLGGWPDLPSVESWPRVDGRPLSFLGQVNLETVASNPGCDVLPRSGLLSFWYDTKEHPWGYDPKDAGHARVLFLPATNLTRMTPPEGPVQSAFFGLIRRQYLPHTYMACELQPCSRITIPDQEDLVMSGIELSEDESDRYLEMREKIAGSGSGIHQLLGHPNLIQGEMQTECQLVSNGIYCGTPDGYKTEQALQLVAGAKDWTLLFEFADDDNAEMHFCDVASLYFWIRRSDLEAGDFSHTWTILQTT